MASRKLTKFTVAALALALVSAGASALAQAQSSKSDNTATGISQPSIHSKLNLNTIGIVRKLPVKDGQVVKKGELLLELDDRQEQAELESLTMEATSDVEIKATEADRDLKKVELKRVESLAAKGSATPSELEEAQIKAVYADAQVDLAKLKQKTKGFEAKKQSIKIEQMRLVSEVDCVVEQINVSVGEVTSPDPQKPVMTVAQLNPLWVEFWLPTSQAQKLKVGQNMEVKYDGQAQYQQGKLIYRAPVAQASSTMQQLRLEIPNPENIDAGQQMIVKLPPELRAAPSGTALLPGAQP